MTDTAPTAVENPSWQDQLASLLPLLTSYAQSKITYKAALLNAKAKLALAGPPPQAATSIPPASDTSGVGKWAPWIAGGLVVVAVFVALRR